MRKLFLRLLIGLIFVYLAGFAFHFAVSVVRFPSNEIDPGTMLQWRWIFGSTFASYLSYFIPLHLSGVLIGFALLLGAWHREHESLQRPLYEVMQVGIMLFLGLGLFYSLGYGLGLPVAQEMQTSAVSESRFARHAFDRAVELEARGEYRAAAMEYRAYLSVHSYDTSTAQHMEDILSRQEAGAGSDGGVRDGRDEPELPLGLTGAELLRRSERAYEQEDFFTAHYYATLALPIGGEIEAEGRRLAARAYRQIERMSESQLEAETARLFAEKRRGYDALLAARPIEAYYIFKALAENAPRDPDVQRYLPIAQDQLEHVSFFVDELRMLNDYMSSSDVFFRLAHGDGAQLFVHMSLFTPTAEAAYARGIEAVLLGPNGELEYHLRAPYGKLIEGHLSLQALDRDYPGLGYEAEYLEGTPPEDASNLLNLSLDAGELLGLSYASAPPATVPAAVLLDLAPRAREFGLAANPMYLELFSRLVHPFSFVSLSFLAAGFGWRMRSRYLAPPIVAAVLAVPLLPFIMTYVFASYLYLNKVVLAVLIVFGGATLGLVGTVVIQAGVLVAALLIMALQPAD
ncbi:MAG: hypothetical protein LC641_11830 [Spirochaeta sp.]|nr:hypothetical protein [Spirochaeta sp.]